MEGRKRHKAELHEARDASADQLQHSEQGDAGDYDNDITQPLDLMELRDELLVLICGHLPAHYLLSTVSAVRSPVPRMQAPTRALCDSMPNFNTACSIRSPCSSLAPCIYSACMSQQCPTYLGQMRPSSSRFPRLQRRSASAWHRPASLHSSRSARATAGPCLAGHAGRPRCRAVSPGTPCTTSMLVEPAACLVSSQCARP
jgi:hypothetical protein